MFIVLKGLAVYCTFILIVNK
uniref:Uncharacterized protein n=1 Tax=Anguilla anguilla TaxID=7936 RepID=A0A0E9RTC1_ANGAN